MLRNSNVNWAGNAFILPYTMMTFAFHFLLSKNLCNTFPSVDLPGMPWSLTNFAHGIITMFYFHWIKGTPDHYGQGDLNGMTWYEQLAASPNAELNDSFFARRYLFLAPVVLCFLGCTTSAYEPTATVANLVVCGVCVGAKLQAMHGVRVFGINSTAGIDDDFRVKKCVGGGERKED